MPSPHSPTFDDPAAIVADVLILGAGAAGLMCAAQAGLRGRSVVVLERNAEIGEKIRISGGGRCNFTNRIVRPENFISTNPDFVRSPIARFPADAFIDMVESHNIPYHEKTLGQLFCDKSSREIITMLRKECADAGVRILTGSEIVSVTKPADKFVIETVLHGVVSAPSLVVATGGLSIPKIGATDLGYRIAREFGITVTDLRPGLVPFVLGDAEREWLAPLSGVSLDVTVACNNVEFREHMLVTHRGLSGPVILQISSYWRSGDSITIDLLPGIDALEFLAEPRPSGATLPVLLSTKWPQRFARAFCEHYDIARPLNHIDQRARAEIAGLLNGWRLTPTGTEGFEKAEVTLGGVDTRELSSKTMESTRVRGLYFIGEVVDVTGWLGGYNFQWAWASGYAAGQFV